MALPVASYLVVSNVSEHKTWSAQYCALRAPIPLAGFTTPDSGVAAFFQRLPLCEAI